MTITQAISREKSRALSVIREHGKMLERWGVSCHDESTVRMAFRVLNNEFPSGNGDRASVMEEEQRPKGVEPRYPSNSGRCFGNPAQINRDKAPNSRPAPTDSCVPSDCPYDGGAA